MSMKPIDFSRQTFEDLKSNLSETRDRVYRAWLAHGPGTTREVAAKSGINLLILRPRSTDLYQLGLIELLDIVGVTDSRNHEGVYRARTMDEWEKFVASKRVPSNPQLSLTV
jgi:hypothetical protein